MPKNDGYGLTIYWRALKKYVARSNWMRAPLRCSPSIMFERDEVTPLTCFGSPDTLVPEVRLSLVGRHERTAVKRRDNDVFFQPHIRADSQKIKLSICHKPFVNALRSNCAHRP